MSNDVTQDVAVLVRIPSSLGLSPREVAALEAKWQDDLARAAASHQAALRVKFHISIHIEIGNE